MLHYFAIVQSTFMASSLLLLLNVAFRCARGVLIASSRSFVVNAHSLRWRAAVATLALRRRAGDTTAVFAIQFSLLLARVASPICDWNAL